METLGSLEELAKLVASGGTFYVRYSKGPKHDAGTVSRDYESGMDMPGLSVNPLVPEPWWDRPVEQWIARQLCQYMELQDRADDRCAWILTGRVDGFGPDREPLLGDWNCVALLSDDLLDEAQRLYEERFDVGRDSTS